LEINGLEGLAFFLVIDPKKFDQKIRYKKNLNRSSPRKYRMAVLELATDVG